MFSAILTAFIIESYQQLQSDPAELTVQLLLYLSQQLANSSLPAVPEPSFSPASSSTRINIFWFCGLVISLITASFGILTKQWLREYLIHESSAEVHLRIRFFRFEGWEKWHVSEIVAMLPFLLQFSMLLFFLGLKEFLNPLDKNVDKAVSALVYSWASLVLAVTLAPVISARCPWKTPILHRPLHRIRVLLFGCYKGFQVWRHNGYKLKNDWNLRSWCNKGGVWLQNGITSTFAAVPTMPKTAVDIIVAFFFPRDGLWYQPPEKVEEEDISQKADADFKHLLGTYQLVQTDEHLLSVIGALGGNVYSLNEVIQCLAGINKLRRSYTEAAWPIGNPVLYGPSVVPSLCELLMNKIQRYVKWSGSTTSDLVTALHFLLDSYSEKFVDGKVLWPLLGGMLLDHHFTLAMLRIFVKSWEAIRDVPMFPQLGQSDSKSTSSHRSS